MRLHRLANARYADLSGIGGAHRSGRWHSGGREVVYLAESCALALVEILVNLDIPPELLPDYVHMVVEVPEDVWAAREVAGTEALPPDWRAPTHGDGPRETGDDWLAGDRSALFEVPSAVVPTEHNVLLNPAHPDSARCTVVSAEPFALDRRLFAVG